MTADSAVRFGAHEVERADADMSRTFRVTRFPWFGVQAEEQGKRAAEHAKQCARHLQLRGNGKVVDFMVMQISESPADYRTFHHHIGIREDQQFTRGSFPAEMLGVILAEPALGQLCDVD